MLLGMRRRNGESEEICWLGEGQAFREKEGDIGATRSTGKENTDIATIILTNTIEFELTFNYNSKLTWL